MSVEYTRAKVTTMEQQWTRDGLGYWVARLRQPVAGASANTFVGVGGCAIEANEEWWNLYYRLRPESHGHGFATEICHAALAAAHAIDAERPVLANLLEENKASKATAERAGLHLQWRGHGRSNPKPCALFTLTDRSTLINSRQSSLTSNVPFPSIGQRAGSPRTTSQSSILCAMASPACSGSLSSTGHGSSCGKPLTLTLV